MISEETEVTMTLKSLVAFASLLVTILFTYFETVEELHELEKDVAIIKDDLSEAQANIRELAVREMDK